MKLEAGMIVKNVISTEAVTINKVQPMGDMISIWYTGCLSNKNSSQMLTPDRIEQLEIIGNTEFFNFEGNPDRFLLYAEAERIYSAYQFDPLFAVNCSVVDPLPHQIEAVYKYLLPQPKIRFLLADDTGAGKTIMTGLLLKELTIRGFVERILIITPGGLTKQWQEDEMDLKFNIPFKLVNRAVFQTEPMVFSQCNRIITSIDFLRNEDILNVVKETSWDIIVVDEAHKLSAFDYGQKSKESKRYKCLATLSSKCDHLLLLTATPHRGRTDTFRKLLQLLDKDIFATDSLTTNRINQNEKTGINKFFIRRLKEDMKDWEGKPLFKKRITKTTLYQLTSQEKNLYEYVTNYLSEKRKEATRDSNTHVSLALMVMQRRLTSSIYALKRTLEKRYNSLKSLLDSVSKNPNFLKQWSQKQKYEEDFETVDDFDELNDREREKFEDAFDDPQKYRLFTTAKNPDEIKKEADQVKNLLKIAQELYNSDQEERKFTKLRELLQNEGALERNEKLVIFTEHKDTLDYLERRLKKNGYTISTIHGGKSVEERREAQVQFARNTQILIATDAAGEGINLQFCRLLINWDIPWNPNRLEQRMGRIHRYGQKNDVNIFNLVSDDTLEGKVLKLLLQKLDLIREQIGDDRVYDVISDIFKDVNLDDIIRTTFDGESTSYKTVIDTEITPERIREKIEIQQNALEHSTVDYKDVQSLKENSEEKRLQPIYIKNFFKKAFKELGGEYTQVKEHIFKIDTMPESLIQVLKEDYNSMSDPSKILFCFDKKIFLEYLEGAELEKIHYINPGSRVFDSIVKIVRKNYKEDMMLGTILISPDDKEDYYAFYVKSQINDQRSRKDEDSIADEQLLIVIGTPDQNYRATSPAKFIDLYPPTEFAKVINPPAPIAKDLVNEWSLNNITLPQFYRTQKRVEVDSEKRKEYLEEYFTKAISEIMVESIDLQKKINDGNNNSPRILEKLKEKIKEKDEQIRNLKIQKEERYKKLEAMKNVLMKSPETLGCAYVQSLTHTEYKETYGMTRDDEMETIAITLAMNYERHQGRKPENVSLENLGYDIRSVSPEEIKRYIEVKGRSGEDGVMLSENEWNRLAQLGESAWLYIVVNCKHTPQLYTFQDPANPRNLSYEKLDKGIQYFLPLSEWKKKLK